MGRVELEEARAAARRRAIASMVALLPLGLPLSCHRHYWFGGTSLGPAAWIQTPCELPPSVGADWREYDLQGAHFHVPADFRAHRGDGGRSLHFDRPGDRITAALTTEHDAGRLLGEHSGRVGACTFEQGPRAVDLIAYASPDGAFVATALWPDVTRTYSLRISISSERPLAADSLRAVLTSVRFPDDSINFRRP